MEPTKAEPAKVDLPTLHRYGLSDWHVTVQYDEYEDGENCGHVLVRPEFREAAVTLFPKVIEERAKRYPSESRRATLEHELCEVVVADCFQNVPEEITEREDFTRACDIMAERLRQLVTRAGG